MRIAITGSDGRIGRMITQDLFKSGFEIVAVNRSHLMASKKSIEARYADLSNPGEAYEALKGVDAIVHLAAISSPGVKDNSEVFSNNVVATYNVLEAAYAHNILRVVVASSIAVIGTVFCGMFDNDKFVVNYLPIDEEHPLYPIDPYGLSKQIDELTGLSFSRRRRDMTIIALRFSWVTFPADYVEIARQANIVPGMVNTLWSYVDIRDVAKAIHLSLRAKVTGFETVNITAADTLSLIPTQELIACYLPQSHIVNNSFSDRATLFNLKKATDLLGYMPIYTWSQYINQ